MAVSAPAQIELLKKKDAFVHAYMTTRKGGDSSYCFADNEDDRFTLHIAPPQGEYRIHIFVESAGRQNFLGELVIESSILASGAIRGPTLYSTYFSTGAKLVNPKFQRISPGMDLEVSIYIPKTSKAVLIINSRITPLEKTSDGMYTKTITVPAARDIVIAAVLGSGSSYTGIVSLPVQ